MKQNSHRASDRCDRSGVEALPHRHTRRLDGYSLYTAGQLRVPRAAALGRGPIRSTPRQLGWWGTAAQGRRRPARGDRAAGRQPAGSAAARQDRSRADRVGAAACLRDRLRLRRLQRRRAPGPGPGAQAPARARSAHRSRPGVPGDAVPVRERGRAAGALSGERRTGRARHRAPPRAARGPRPPHHDRPRPDRRSHPWAARVQLLQWALRPLVLPAGGRDADVQCRADAVRGRRRAAPGHQPGQARRDRAPAAPARPPAGGLPEGAPPNPAGRRLRQPRDLRLLGGRGGRIRGGDGQQCAPASSAAAG